MDLKTLEEKIDSLALKLDNVGSRLEDGDRLFRRLESCQRQLEHAFEAHQALTLRALQSLLLEKATKLQVVKSLAEVTEALERLEREHNERDTMPPDEDTKPNHVVPVRDTDPAPPLEPEPA